MSLKEKLDLSRIPTHIAVIMDGNGRWAKEKGKLRVFGHQNGVKSVRDVTEAAAEVGVKYLTLYAFSTENWNRPRFEIDALMTLLETFLNKELKNLMKNNIRLLFIGNREDLPAKVKKKLVEVIENTKDNSGLSLVLAISYSSQWEIIKAIKQIAQDAKDQLIQPENIDNQLFNSYLATAGIPDPELLIRTSGELRISNFLLWQIAYSELYFTTKFWPDFRKEDFFEAILEYQNRERRFGKTSEQINTKK